MLTETIREFLQRPLIARISVNGSDGYPHTVPVWFALDGEEIVLIGPRKTRKVRLMKANPKGAVVIGGDSADGAGYLFKGEFTIEEDPDNFWLKKMTYRYESKEQAEKDIAEWIPLDNIVMRFRFHQVIKI
jgi:general stress protein 26